MVAVSTSVNWRIVFEFERPNVTNFDLADYQQLNAKGDWTNV
jgi:hypothetical protein